jgi:hypothetical protein
MQERTVVMKSSLIAIVVLFTLNVVRADPPALVVTPPQTVWGNEIGAFIALPMGGDVNDGEVGGGIQGVIPLGGPVAVELAITQFGDSLDIVEMSVTKFSASLRWSIPISVYSDIYLGAGLDYNQMSADVDGGIIAVQMEGAVGYHAVLGLSTRVMNRGILFLDFRLNKLDTTAVVSGFGQSEVVEGQYDHGLFRVGLGLTF